MAHPVLWPVGLLFARAPVRPDMLNMAKSVSTDVVTAFILYYTVRAIERKILYAYAQYTPPTPT